ncbi:MAG TPA: PolC-type DNA polymerase III [Peptococcaceae bacterium]|nr:PolC-type DNA polymerase III [Peptococcaceae bacterium]
MFTTAVKLNEIPFFEQLPEEVIKSLAPYSEKIAFKKVEVIPKERKWILHLSMSEPIDAQVLKILTVTLEKRLNNGIKINIQAEWSTETTLEDVAKKYWEEIIADLVELLPSLQGWLYPAVKHELEGNTLTFFVPNSTAMELCRSKQATIEGYFAQKFGLKVKVFWEIDELIAEEEQSYDPEKEEQKYIEELLSSHKPPKENTKSHVLLGREFQGTLRALKDITEEERQVIVQGEVCEIDSKVLKSGRQLLTFGLTDKTNSIICKMFFEEGQPLLAINKGDWLKIRGQVQFDRYTTELTLRPTDIVLIPPLLRMDNAPEKRVELHLHTKMSEMDGISSVQSLIQRASEWGHEAIAITDHGVVQAFPEAAEAGKKYGLKVILGMEGYLVDDLDDDEDQKPDRAKARYYHIIILAKNRTGLKNLYKLVTESHLKHFYRRPRIPRSLLKTYREGLILGSACEAGELMRAILRGADRDELKAIASFYDYLEIQPTGNNLFLIQRGDVPDVAYLQEINKQIVSLGQEMNIPVVATCDVHFLDREDEIFRRILLAGKGYADADRQTLLYFRTTEEMLEEFAYLGDQAYQVVVTNTRLIAEQIENLKPFPDEFFEPKIEGAPEKIMNMAWSKAHELYGDPLPEIVQKTLQKELDSIIGNGFSVLYLIAHLLVKKSNEDGYLVGSRGSVGSSLVATLTGITEVNPLPPHYRCSNPECLYSEFIQDGSVGSGVDLPDKDCPRCGRPLDKDGHDIPFETFLGFKGDKVPDIDLNFSGEYQARAHKYTEEIFGRENVFRAGTISTVAEKTAYGFVKNYLEERNIRYNQTELNRLVRGCAGVKRTTGQHPGGLMVVPKECDVFDFTPLQRPANDTSSDIITTHFDYHSISGRLVKLDILGHDDPTSIKMLEDLTGVDAKKIKLDDPKTLSLFSGTEALGVTPEEIGTKTGTLGIPEFGTKFVRQMLEETKPKTFSHLVRISGLSHGTNVWVGNAQDLVLNGTADISQIIACRDDIMLYLIQKGMDSGHAFKIMEQVRKGKGLKPEDITAMREHDVPEWYIESCQKISYMFPKAHAVAYVTMAFRIAWFKVYYPEAFYATFFTVRADEFDAELITGGVEKCRAAIEEITRKGNSATPKEKNLLTILELAVEMYCRKIKLLKVDLWKSSATRFLITPEGILPPFSALQGVGKTAALSLEKLRDSGLIRSVEDLQNHGKLSKTIIEVLERHGCLQGLPQKNQLCLF